MSRSYLLFGFLIVILASYDTVCEGFGSLSVSRRPCRYRHGNTNSNHEYSLLHPTARVWKASVTSNAPTNYGDVDDSSTSSTSQNSSLSRTFRMNGQYYTITETNRENVSLQDILDYFDFDSGLFIVEYNKVISPRPDWSSTYIKDKDQIEIITIVGGG
jgi:thiamine biosynthesis protein ThiS